MTSKVFPSTILLWEWLHLSQCPVCFTTVAKYHTCTLYHCLSFDFLEFFSLILGDSTGLSHSDTVCCHLLSGDSTLCCCGLSANDQDDIFCLLWLFCGFWGEKCRCFSVILREFWLTPWVEFSVPPAMEKGVLLNRSYRIELLIFVFFLVSIVLFHANTF